jgi:general secretion pathway protein J
MKSSRGFTLIELLVALVVFAAMAAAAYGGLASIARARAALAAQQDRFAAITRTVSLLERDLRQGVARTVLGNTGSQPLPALMGGSDGIEFTRLGYANPLAEPRSNLERVVYAFDGGKLQRGRYLVLDRAPNSAPVTSTLLDRVEQFHLRYFGGDGAWRDAWPPSDPLPSDPPLLDPNARLPRAVEFRFTLQDLGEIRRVVELPSPLSHCGVVGDGSVGSCQ